MCSKQKQKLVLPKAAHRSDSMQALPPTCVHRLLHQPLHARPQRHGTALHQRHKQVCLELVQLGDQRPAGLRVLRARVSGCVVYSSC